MGYPAPPGHETRRALPDPPVARRRIHPIPARAMSLVAKSSNRRHTNMFKGLGLALTLIIGGMIGAPALILLAV